MLKVRYSKILKFRYIASNSFLPLPCVLRRYRTKQSKYRLSKSSRFDSSIIGIVYAELDFRMISITFIIYQQKYGCRRHEASVNMQRLRTSPAMLEFGFPAAFFILRPRCWAKNCLKLCGTFFFCYCSQRGKSPLTHPAVNPHWLFFVF